MKHAIIGNEGQLVFSTENSVAASASTTGSGGIGLENVQRQLEINYQNKFALQMEKEGGVFRVKLILQLGKS